MSERYKNLYAEVLKNVSGKRYDVAKSKLDGMDKVKDQLLSRSYYLVYGTPSSPFFDPSIAKDHLNFLESSSDSWGLAEKGRCLLFGELWEKDTHKAEDILIKAMKKEPKAMFYIAYIHANGIHLDDSDDPVYDIAEATRLYKQISGGESRYRDKACLEYCKLSMAGDGSVSIEVRAEVFALLLGLTKTGNPDALRVMSSFLVSETSIAVDEKFSSSNVPASMPGRIAFESSHRQCLSSIKTLSKELCV